MMYQESNKSAIPTFLGYSKIEAGCFSPIEHQCLIYLCNLRNLGVQNSETEEGYTNEERRRTKVQSRKPSRKAQLQLLKNKQWSFSCILLSGHHPPLRGLLCILL